MWLQLGLFGGAIVVAAAVLTRFWRRRSSTNRIDVGSVSQSWLAEERRRGSDSH